MLNLPPISLAPECVVLRTPKIRISSDIDALICSYKWLNGCMERILRLSFLRRVIFSLTRTSLSLDNLPQIIAQLDSVLLLSA